MIGNSDWVFYPAGATALCVVGFFVLVILRRMASPVRVGWISTVFAVLLSACGIGAFAFGGAGAHMVWIAPAVVAFSVGMMALAGVWDEVRWPRDR